MVEPLTLAWFATAALGGVIGGRSDELFCKSMLNAKRVMLGALSEPKNHDVARSIRQSQIFSLQLLLKAYERLPDHPRGPRNKSGFVAGSIVNPLTAWANAELSNSKSLKKKIREYKKRRASAGWSRTTSADELTQLEKLYKGLFANPSLGNKSALRRYETVEKETTKLFLNELLLVFSEDGSIVPKDWERFCALATRTGEFAAHDFPGFFPLYRSFFAEEIKTNQKVSRLLTQEKLDGILDRIEDLHVMVAQLTAGFDDFMRQSEQQRKEVKSAVNAILRSRRAIETAIQRIDRANDQLVLTLHSIEKQLWLERRLPGFSRGYMDPDLAMIRERPNAVLIARYNIIPFVEIGSAYRDAIDWCLMSERKVSGRLYEGSGGIGKTRLFLELCATLRKQGWCAGFLDKPQDGDGFDWANQLEVFLKARPGINALFVIDYAETRPHDLAKMELLVRKFSDRRIKVVGIARSGGTWWKSAADRPDSIFDPHEIQPFDEADFPTNEFDAFRHLSEVAISKCFKAANLIESNDDPKNTKFAFKERSGSQEDFFEGRRPLTACLSALSSVLQKYDAVDRSIFESASSPLDAIGALEESYWKRAIGNATPPALLKAGCAVTAATLFQGAEAESFSFVDNIPIVSDDINVSQIISKLSLLYPHQSLALGCVEPDLLGEHLTGRYIKRLGLVGSDAVSIGLKNSCANEFIDSAWSVASEKQRVDLLTVLNRTTRKEHEASGVRMGAISALEHLTPRSLRAPKSTATATLARVGQLVPILSLGLNDLECAELFDLLERCIDVGHTRNSPFVVEIVSSIQSKCPDSLVKLSATLERAEQDALFTLDSKKIESIRGNPTRETKDLRWTISQSKQGAQAASDRTTVTSSISNVGSSLRRGNSISDHRFREEFDEIVDAISRWLLQSEQERSEMQSAVLTGPAGAGKTTIAYRLADQLTHKNWEVLYLDGSHSPQDLKGTLDQISTTSSCAVLVDYADLAIERGVLEWTINELSRFSRTRTEADHDVSSIGLMRTVFIGRPSNLSNQILDRFDQHIFHLEQFSVEPLVSPAVRLSIDAMLNDSSRKLNIGRIGQAIQSAQSAVESANQLLETRGDAGIYALARTRNHLAHILSVSGNLSAAKESLHAVIESTREHIQTKPEIYLVELVRALTQLTEVQILEGFHEGALASVDEGLKLAGNPPDMRVEADLNDAIGTLYDLKARLSFMMGDSDEAIHLAGRAIEAFDRYQERQGGDVRASVGSVLNRKLDYQAQAGRLEEAKQTAVESRKLFTELYESNPELHIAEYFQALLGEARIDFFLGRIIDARARIDQIISNARARENPNSLALYRAIVDALFLGARIENKLENRSSALLHLREAKNLISEESAIISESARRPNVNKSILIELAELLLATEDYEQASTEFLRSAMIVDPFEDGWNDAREELASRIASGWFQALYALNLSSDSVDALLTEHEQEGLPKADFYRSFHTKIYPLVLAYQELHIDEVDFYVRGKAIGLSNEVIDGFVKHSPSNKPIASFDVSEGSLSEVTESLLVHQLELAPSWPLQPAFQSTWETLAPEPAFDVVRAAIVSLKKNSVRGSRRLQKACAVRRTELPFYRAHNLIEILVVDEDAFKTLSLVIGPKKYYWLTGHSLDIHTLNAEASVELSNQTQASRYLDFFCGYSHGEDGPFRVVASEEEEYPDFQTNYSRNDVTRRRILEAFQTPEATDAHEPLSSETNEGIFSAKRILSHGGRLFVAGFEIAANGTVKMVSDAVLPDTALDDVISQNAYVKERIERGWRKRIY